MTRSNSTSPTIRQTFSTYRGREIVVAIFATWLTLRLKGTRKSYAIDIEGAFQYAAKKEAEKARAEQKTRRRV